jgi:hypothetical protein
MFRVWVRNGIGGGQRPVRAGVAPVVAGHYPQVRSDEGLPQYRDAEGSDVFVLSGSREPTPWGHQRGALTPGSGSKRPQTPHRGRHPRLGLLLVVAVTTASLQDRDGRARVLEQLRFRMLSVVTVFADGGYAGRLVLYARQVLRVVVELVRSGSPPTSKGSPSCTTLGGRADLRLDRALPTSRPRLRNVFPPPPKPWSSGP